MKTAIAINRSLAAGAFPTRVAGTIMSALVVATVLAVHITSVSTPMWVTLALPHVSIVSSIDTMHTAIFAVVMLAARTRSLKILLLKATRAHTVTMRKVATIQRKISTLHFGYTNCHNRSAKV